jgi:hypothetical protein
MISAISVTDLPKYLLLMVGSPRRRLIASTKGSLTRGKYRVNTIRALFFGTLDIQAFSRGARSRRRVR